MFAKKIMSHLNAFFIIGIIFSSISYATEVTRDFSGRTVKFKNININNTGINNATVRPGANISITLDWQSSYTSEFCPGCIQQFYVGLKDQGINCLYSGNTLSNRSGNGSIDFIAPTEPGIYVIQASDSLQFSCTNTASSMSISTDDALGYIRVVPSDTRVERNLAGRTVTFSNVSLNETGIDNIRVAPGANISISVDWASEYTSTFCPGCIQQLYIGVKDEAINCMYSGFTNTNLTGTDTLNFFAPNEPGIYVVQAAESLQFSCTLGAEGISNSTTGAIGSFEVLAN